MNNRNDMNKHIIVLTSIYLGKPSANGICAHNIVNELVNRGYYVDVICYESKEIYTKEDYVNIFTIQYDNKRKSMFKRVVERIQMIFGSSSFATNKCLVKMYYNRIMEIISHEFQVEAIIGMFFPLEAIEALYRVKRKFGIPTIFYELDSIGDGIAKTQINTALDKAYGKWLTKMYSNANYIIVMKSHRDYWNETFGKMYSSKVRFADIPVLKFNKTHSSYNRNNCIVMVYSGLLEEQYRSPRYALKTLEACKDILGVHFKCLFYSRGDCEDFLAEYSVNHQFVIPKGYVSPDVLETVFENTDVFISIGNTSSNSLPSKLIAYISYGKPIIHFTNQNSDICVKYLENYPLALIVNQQVSLTDNARSIYDFLKKVKDKQVDKDYIDDMYEMNTPRYSCDLIEECIINAQ